MATSSTQRIWHQLAAVAIAGMLGYLVFFVYSYRSTVPNEFERQFAPRKTEFSKKLSPDQLNAWRLRDEVSRQRDNRPFPGSLIARISTGAALISVVFAFAWTRPNVTTVVRHGENVNVQVPKPWAIFLIAAWALIPPIFQTFEFVEWQPNEGRLKYFEHGQELARYVWVAFLVLLSLITGVKWQVFGGE